jgi:hypothetical protein
MRQEGKSQRKRKNTNRRHAEDYKGRCDARMQRKELFLSELQERIPLAGRPVHLAPAHEVDVEVVDGLAAFGAGADDDAVAFAEPLLARDVGRCVKKTAKQGFVSGFSMGQRREMLLRDDQNVRRRLWVDVVEGEDLIVFPNLLRRNRAGSDFAEDAVHGFSF